MADTDYKSLYIYEKSKNEIYIDLIKTLTDKDAKTFITESGNLLFIDDIEVQKYKSLIFTGKLRNDDTFGSRKKNKKSHGFPSSKDKKKIMTITDVKNVIQKCMNDLEDTLNDISILKNDKYDIEMRTNNILGMLNTSRNGLCGFLQEEEYLEFLKEHYTELFDIISRIQEKSHIAFSDLCWSSYDKRLLYMKTPHNYLLSCESIKDILNLIKLRKRTTELFPFDRTFNIPNLCLFLPIDTLIKEVITKNIVYIPMSNSKGPDYYSFYILESNNDKKIWKLDPYLTDVCKLLSARIKHVGEKLWKSFYRNVFSHNEYKLECINILEKYPRYKQYKNVYDNLKTVSDSFLFGNIVRQIVKSDNIYYPTDDIINGNKEPVYQRELFSKIRKRIKEGLPPDDDENLEYLDMLYDKYNDWNYEKSRDEYISFYKKMFG